MLQENCAQSNCRIIPKKLRDMKREEICRLLADKVNKLKNKENSLSELFPMCVCFMARRLSHVHR